MLVQLAHQFIRCVDCRALDLDDDVARSQTGLLRWRVLEHLDHEHARVALGAERVTQLAVELLDTHTQTAAPLRRHEVHVAVAALQPAQLLEPLKPPHAFKTFHALDLDLAVRALEHLDVEVLELVLELVLRYFTAVDDDAAVHVAVSAVLRITLAVAVAVTAVIRARGTGRARRKWRARGGRRHRDLDPAVIVDRHLAHGQRQRPALAVPPDTE